MGHDEWRGQKFETEDTLLRSFLYVSGVDRFSFATGGKRFANFLQHLDEIRTGAATRIEHEHAWVGEAIGNIQFLTQRGVHAGDLILYNFRWRVPDAQFLPQFRIERF